MPKKREYVPVKKKKSTLSSAGKVALFSRVNYPVTIVTSTSSFMLSPAERTKAVFLRKDIISVDGFAVNTNEFSTRVHII